MKTPEQYKEELIKLSSTGFLLRMWAASRSHWYIDYWYDEIPKQVRSVKIRDEVWSKESGTPKYHEWSVEEFKTILNSRPHYPSKTESKQKRQLLAHKYKKGRKQF